MGRALIITDDTLKRYCTISTDQALTHRQRRRMGAAIVEAEQMIVLVPDVRSDFPRVMQAGITVDITSPFEPRRELCAAVSVIRHPRYDVSNREAPKRSTLIRRLWSALR